MNRRFFVLLETFFSNFTAVLECFGIKLFSNVAEVVKISSDNPSDVYAKFLSIEPVSTLEDSKIS